MKNYLLSLLLVFIAFASVAQKEANIWYFGKNAGVDFNSGTPVAITNGKVNTDEGSASISDKTTGQLLFYTDGITVWDRTHTAMPNGTGLKGNISSTQSSVIVPRPGSTTIYYIFTVDAQAGHNPPSTTGYGGLAYSIVDMTLNAGNGNITTKNTNLLTPTSEKVAAVKHCNGKDVWILTHQWNTNAFYAYLLTPFGLTAPTISSIGVVHKDNGSTINQDAIGYMKFSPDGKKLAVASYANINRLEILDFNNQTGALSNLITDTYPNPTGYDGPYGVSFSPDNSRLYVTNYGCSMFPCSTTISPSYVYQYNMLAGSNAAILASKTTVATRSGFGLGALQTAPDGKIYVAQGDEAPGPYLDVIRNPNALGAACNYTNNGFYLGTKLCRLGLPDVVESFVGTPYSGTLTYPVCTGNDSVVFTDNSINGTISVYWDFGDPGSGVNNSSGLQNPTHTFSSSGTYTVTMYVSNDCVTDTIVKTVTVSAGSVSISAGPDVTVCSNDSTRITVSGIPGGSIISWNPSTGLSCTNCGNPYAKPTSTTTYIITANSGGCIGTDSVKVTVSPGLNAVAGPDTTVCAGNFVELHASGGTSYVWSPGNSLSDSTIADPISFAFVSTTYTVTASGGTCPSSSATATIQVAPSPPVPNISQSQDTLYCRFDPSYTSYQWYFNSSPIPGETHPYLVINQNGNYNVAVKNAEGCEISVGIIILSTTNNGFINNSIFLSPNSISHDLGVHGNNLNGKLLINIYDVPGRLLVATEDVVNGVLRKNIDISKFAKGVYFVELQQAQSKWVGKFVKD